MQIFSYLCSAKEIAKSQPRRWPAVRNDGGAGLQSRMWHFVTSDVALCGPVGGTLRTTNLEAAKHKTAGRQSKPYV